jgi:CheY-like chemotaxis protein
MTQLLPHGGPGTVSPGSGTAEDDREPGRWLPYLVAIPLPAVGLVATFVYAWGDSDILAVALLVAAGAFLAGGLLGFLFGIPRSLANPQGGEDDSISGAPQPNTNLEQISDWLTKILVGVGLVQFTTLAQHAGELVEFLGPPLGGGALGESFAAATLVVFGISGFLAFYLVTRIYLPLAFAYTDRKARALVAYKKVRVAIGADAVREAERQVTGKQADYKQVLTTVEGLTEITATRGPAQVLWVDNTPEGNSRERDLMTTMDMTVTTCLSTDDALGLLGRPDSHFDVVISNMARPPDDRAGYTLLGKMRAKGNMTPFIVYSGSDNPEHDQLAKSRGALGSTNRPHQLLDLVRQALGGRQ